MAHSRQALPAVTVAAIGVVFGDIGTSPLYALKEIFSGHHPLPVTPDNILGMLSLVFWAIMLLVSFKYVALIMRADNRGEGGSLALLALLTERASSPRLAGAVTFPDQLAGGPPARAAAQPETQSGTARAPRPTDRPHDRFALCH